MTPISPVETVLALSQQVERLKAELEKEKQLTKQIAEESFEYGINTALEANIKKASESYEHCRRSGHTQKAVALSGFIRIMKELQQSFCEKRGTSSPAPRIAELQAQLAAAQQQAAESAALAERMRDCLHQLCPLTWVSSSSAYGKGAQTQVRRLFGIDPCPPIIESALAFTPAAALAHYRDEVLEEVAQQAENNATYAEEAAKQADAKLHASNYRKWNERAGTLRTVAEKIRAMKEAK